MFSFRNVEFIYEPYPMGVAPGVLEPSVYTRLSESFPPKDRFEFKAVLGNKYSLSELNNHRQYHEFVRSSPDWRAFHDYIKGRGFLADVFGALREHHIDLGIAAERSPDAVLRSLRGRLRRALRRGGEPEIYTRFEFSMLPAAGGCIRPHTDDPQKIVTLVVSMQRPGEWNASYGGATDVLKPKDLRQSYNHLNRSLDFEAVDTVRSFPYVENQCLVFVKTFNSLHAVKPMTGTSPGVMRKTLTVNIETRS